MDRNQEIKARRELSVTTGHASVFPNYAVKAKGSIITDANGDDYIDFGGGVGVMNLGHCNPKVVAAIKDQAEKFHHTGFFIMPYEGYVALAEKLCAMAPGDSPKRALFVNSGAEAVENAVKIARYYTKRPGILVLEHGYHGRTTLTMTMTAKDMPFKHGFGPLATDIHRMAAPYCYRCHFNETYPECGLKCAEYLEEYFATQVSADRIAAIVVEPVMGEGGFIVPPDGYWQRIKEICEKYDILFVADEIQAGMGRTGKAFSIQNWQGVEPDIITVAKSMASGMPIAGVIGKQEVMDSVHPGGVGGTYSGNPIACAAALASLEVYEEENIEDKSIAMGAKLMARLEQWKEQFPAIGDVRGIGSMVAMEMVADRETKAPAADLAKKLHLFAFEHKLLVLVTGTYGNVIRFLMPLTTPDDLLEKGMDILEEGLKTLES